MGLLENLKSVQTPTAQELKLSYRIVLKTYNSFNKRNKDTATVNLTSNTTGNIRWEVINLFLMREVKDFSSFAMQIVKERRL